jgi:hypothetical protein
MYSPLLYVPALAAMSARFIAREVAVLLKFDDSV